MKKIANMLLASCFLLLASQVNAANIYNASELILKSDFCYATKNRYFQGVASIDVSKAGTKWAAWYAGGYGEGQLNYVVIARKKPQENWEEIYIIDNNDSLPLCNKDESRVFDPSIKIDGDNNVIVFFTEGTSARDYHSNFAILGNADSSPLQPEIINIIKVTKGVSLNKPILINNKEWLLPIAEWGVQLRLVHFDKNWEILREIIHPIKNVEPFIVQEDPDKLKILARSHSGQKEWTYSLTESKFEGPVISLNYPQECMTKGIGVFEKNIRYNVRNNSKKSESCPKQDIWSESLWDMRTNLTLSINGKDFLIDSRERVSYPDLKVDDDVIYIIYDRYRGSCNEIILATMKNDAISRETISKGRNLPNKPTCN